MTLTLNTDGLRLDAALAALLPELSRSAVQRRRAKSLNELRIKLAALMPKGG